MEKFNIDQTFVRPCGAGILSQRFLLIIPLVLCGACLASNPGAGNKGNGFSVWGLLTNELQGPRIGY